MSEHAAAITDTVAQKDGLCILRHGEVKINWDDVAIDGRRLPTLQDVTSSMLRKRIRCFDSMSSFHSDDVEKLIALDESVYVAPACLPLFAQRILTKQELSGVGAGQAGLPCGESGQQQACSSYAECQIAIAQMYGAEVNDKTNTDAPGTSRLCTNDVTCAPTAKDGSLDAHSCLCDVNLSSAVSRAMASGERCIGSDRYNVVATRKGRAESGTPSSMCNSATASCTTLLSDTSCVCAKSEPATTKRWSTRLASSVDTHQEMGRSFRERHFSITEDVVFINHGAFGGAIAGGLAIKHAYDYHMEHESVAFVDRELLPLLVHSVRALSHFLGANPRHVVIAINATHALNSAIQLIQRGDVVAYLDTEYLSVYKMMYSRCQHVGATLHEMELNCYLHDDAVLGDDDALTAAIVAQLPAGCTVCVLDHITSTTALALPLFTAIIPALRTRGVQTIIVDGAHATLQVDLQFSALPPACQPTVFVGNLHKWFSAPKSAGFLWVRAEDVLRMHAVIVSHGAGDGLLSEFIWDGTRDYGSALCIPALAMFWQAQDCARVRAYCSSMLEQVVAMLTCAFHSRRIVRHAPFMSLVELPDTLQDSALTVKFIQDVLYKDYKLEVPVKCIKGRFYLRVSVFVYNVSNDYVYLRDAILSLCDSWTLARSEVTRMSCSGTSR